MSNVPVPVVDGSEPFDIQLQLTVLTTPFEVRYLRTGDYIITDCNVVRYGLERKAIKDLLASIPPKGTGKNPELSRLSDQLNRCFDAFGHVGLILEGHWDITEDKKVRVWKRGRTGWRSETTGWRVEPFWGKLREVQEAHPGLTVFPTPDHLGTARLIDLLYRQAGTRGF